MIWYCDYKNDSPFELHKYMQQFVTNNSDAIDNFTIQPSIDSTILEEFNKKIVIKTFDEYQPNTNGYVFIGLHGGWTTLKLHYIKEWFVNDANRSCAWHDRSCKIVLDYSMEGFGEEVFDDLNQWVQENNLCDRVVYVSGDLNIKENFNNWARQRNTVGLFAVAYYGFFAVWASRHLTPTAQTTSRQRYMCLNRRPHYHRILMLTLLERKGIVDAGTISMPRDFIEPDIGWADDQWDLTRLWNELKDLLNGGIDRLEPDFQRLLARLPLTADRSDFETNHAIDFNSDLYSEHPVNLITETLCFTNSAFASEKIWKPIAAGQIFLVLSGPFYLKGLRRLGFKTFAPYVNEEYDLETDPVERAVMVANELKRLISMNASDFAQFIKNCQTITEHNKLLLNNQAKMKTVIAKQLVKTLEG